MGSSMVTMCRGLDRLMMSTNDANVVDFPDPVGPVTSTSPWRSSVNMRTDSGTPKSLEGGNLVRDGPQDAGDGSTLLEDVQPEPPHTRNRV